jgi:POT family proton-dependent oligopeptide transporter
MSTTITANPSQISTSPHVNSGTLFGHPIGLFVLFFTEMWERFSYYGMRGLLKLYMVNYLFVASRQVVQGGEGRMAGDPLMVLGWSTIRHWINSDPNTTVGSYASVIYGWYTGLVYLTPVLGGYIADKYWGQRKTVFIGAVLMAIGHFVMAFENWFFIALAFLIVGCGAFKPNISTQVGALYPEGDSRRDGAFTIFYMGINLGAFICNLVCGTLAAVYGWHYGFGAAGVGMVIGLIIYSWGQKYLAPDNLQSTPKAAGKATDAAPAVKQKLTSAEWKAVWALVGLCLLNVVFWAAYEQQGNTMQTWADERTIWPTLFGWQIPATWFQSFNPLFSFMLAPFLDMFWGWQQRRGKEPSSVAKMAIGSVILGLSFIVMVVGARMVGDGKGSWFWPVFCTLALTVGELYLSPIGLSLVTKVSPARIVSMMMGMWFLSSFLGNLLSGYIGVLFEQKILGAEQFFLLLTVLGVGTGLAIWAFSRPLRRAIGHEV